MKLDSTNVSGMVILVLASFFGIRYPMAARWILLTLCVLGICSYFTSEK